MIQNRNARHHANVQDGALDLCLFIGNHRRTPHFRAGASRRRQRNYWRNTVWIGAQVVLADVFEIPQRAGLA